ncbi:MAG: SH3 domain-containing protein [Clostridia bacterium]|nr:SH3 domain-containing protein [Clostridia bacterium]MBQ4451823.1 SH3 domain-containing protein [Clostridia bacterium]
MKKFLSILLVVCMLACMMLTAFGETVKLAYSSGSVKLRTGAGTKYSANGVVKNGDTITVLSKGKNWTKIRTADSREGYIKNLYIDGIGSHYASGTTYTAHRTGKVVTKYSSSTVNMRAGAAHSEVAIGKLKSGAKVTVLGKNGSWYLVANSSGTQGFVHSKYISVGGSSSGSSSTTAKVANCNAVHMRSGKSSTSSIVATLAKNTKVTVLSKSGSWWKVKYGSKTGYIYKKYLK